MLYYCFLLMNNFSALKGHHNLAQGAALEKKQQLFLVLKALSTYHFDLLRPFRTKSLRINFY